MAERADEPRRQASGQGYRRGAGRPAADDQWLLAHADRLRGGQARDRRPADGGPPDHPGTGPVHLDACAVLVPRDAGAGQPRRVPGERGGDVRDDDPRPLPGQRAPWRPAGQGDREWRGVVPGMGWLAPQRAHGRDRIRPHPRDALLRVSLRERRSRRDLQRGDGQLNGARGQSGRGGLRPLPDRDDRRRGRWDRRVPCRHPDGDSRSARHPLRPAERRRGREQGFSPAPA